MQVFTAQIQRDRKVILIVADKNCLRRGILDSLAPDPFRNFANALFVVDLRLLSFDFEFDSSVTVPCLLIDGLQSFFQLKKLGGLKLLDSNQTARGQA